MTVAERLLSISLLEHHNGVLGNTMRKMMSGKTNYSLETGVAWAIAAKNSLKNEYRVWIFFKSISFWKKTQNFPDVEFNKLPALEGVACSKIVAGNLSAIHDARQAFIKSESDEKFRRALRHQIRTSSEVKHVTGDKAYYKKWADNY